jgi:hypothetical protein
MKRSLLLCIATVFLALEGYVHGVWTNRWTNSQELEEALGRLQRVPMKIGDWEGSAEELGPGEAQQAGFAGYFLRRYQKRQDGSVVTVMLACGPAGALSVHTPAVCYGGAGYTLAGPVVKHDSQALASSPAEFWKAKFTKENVATPLNLRIFYSWHARNAWQAADSPRLTFAGLPAIHKLYVTHQMTGANERYDDQLCDEFMRLFLPELEKTAFAPH